MVNLKRGRFVGEEENNGSKSVRTGSVMGGGKGTRIKVGEREQNGSNQ